MAAQASQFPVPKKNKYYPLIALALIAVGVLLNVLPAKLALALNWPLYLDSIGTVLVTLAGGILPGVIVGFASNVINGLNDPITLYYAAISVLLAAATSLLHNSKLFRKVWGFFIAVVMFAFIGGVLGSILTWFLYGSSFGEGISGELVRALYGTGHMTPFLAQVTGDFLIDLVDKTVIVAVTAIAFHFIPEAFRKKLRPNSIAKLEDAGLLKGFRHSLLRKVIVALLLYELVLITVVVGVMTYLYRDTLESKYALIAGSVTELEAGIVDADRVPEYLTEGRDAPGYAETERQLAAVKESFEDIRFLYVYRFEEDGIHVVFDFDSHDAHGDYIKGEEPGTVFEYDESFHELIPALLAGESIDPIITDDTYGWLLTVYRPVTDSNGTVQAYVCADVAMSQVLTDETVFLAKVSALIIGASLVLLAFTLTFAEDKLVYPINAMAAVSKQFAYETEEGRQQSVENVNNLKIDTDDELSDLYEALVQLSNDSTHYIDRIQKMQDAVILDFASMVESRDKRTGGHIRRTSQVVEAVLQELVKDGLYGEELTPALARSMIKSAPLHDIGKIKVSDAILNKPGRLTDEEFAVMKAHTTDGEEILNDILVSTAETGYLREAIDMAYCHHEKWDGTGYPRGLKGEEIPLSARVMAVADVFDALVSKRSYKEPFSFEEAVEIIKDGSGKHFDPRVVEAFLAVSSTLRED